MNNSDIEHMWKVASNNPNHDTNWHDPVVIAFAALVAAQEREAWEHKFARLHQLMDIREIQPNKPCCLAARVDEREACAALCFSIWNKWLDTPEEYRYKVLYDAEDCAAAIRARGTT